MQSLPLEVKILKTKQRIIEWYEHYDGQVYISFSGGKDSTVLLTLARELYPDIQAVYVDTGLEYPEIKKFVSTFKNITILRPEMNFKQILEKYGYPIISKEVADCVSQAKRSIDSNKKLYTVRLQRLDGVLKDNNGNYSQYNIPKYKYLLDSPFKISGKCCDIMKKNPAKLFEKESGKHPILGTMACESRLRLRQYLKFGCNAFSKGKPTSQPISFWLEQDILTYIKDNNIKYCNVYGDLVDDGVLKFTGCQRTGCMFCMFGVHLEKGENRFQKMKQTHPKIYKYCINDLGCGKVLDFIGVKY